MSTSVESRVVVLSGGGSVALTVEVEWLRLSQADFEWIRSVVAMLDGYGDEGPADATPVTARAPARAVAPTRREPRNLKLSDESLANVAAAANAAIAECRDLQSAVAERLGIKPQSASMYIREARRAGHDIPTERPCRHCGRAFALRGVATHERACLDRPIALVAPEEAPRPSVPEPPPASPPAAALKRPKLADEIAELRARDRAVNDAKGRSAVTTDEGDDVELAHLQWTCSDCGQVFTRKMELHRHLADIHDRHHLHAHEEVGAIA